MTSAQIELDAPELRCSAQIALDVIALMPEPSLAIRIEAERLWYMLKEQLSIDSYLDNLERENLEGLL